MKVLLDVKNFGAWKRIEAVYDTMQEHGVSDQIIVHSMFGGLKHKENVNVSHKLMTPNSSTQGINAFTIGWIHQGRSWFRDLSKEFLFEHYSEEWREFLRAKKKEGLTTILTGPITIEEMELFFSEYPETLIDYIIVHHDTFEEGYAK